MRKLASVQVIKDLKPIPNADRIETASILGWQCVVKKGDFKVGDKCVYIEIDSLLPEDNPSFDFLKNSKGHIERIRTKKLRGQISQGLAMPMNILNKDYFVGEDVTDILKIKKWEPDRYNRPARGKASYDVLRFHGKWAKLLLYKKPWTKYIKRFIFSPGKKAWPSYITKTDESRCQSLPDVIAYYAGTKCVVTEKLDGQSITIWFDGNSKLHVASRNLEILDRSNYFWTTVQRLGIEEKLRAFSVQFGDGHPTWTCLQGELCGPDIQGNKYGLKQKDIYFYNVLSINPKEGIIYGSEDDLKVLALSTGLKTVPMLDMDYKLSPNVEDIVEMSKGKSVLADTLREGIVIRPEPTIIDDQGFGGMVGNRVSFKAINPEFLLKWKL